MDYALRHFCLDPEPYNQFQVKYVGNCAVSNPTGIETIRDAIGRLLTIHLESEWTPANALISATTVLFLIIPVFPDRKRFLAASKELATRRSLVFEVVSLQRRAVARPSTIPQLYGDWQRRQVRFLFFGEMRLIS